MSDQKSAVAPADQGGTAFHARATLVVHHRIWAGWAVAIVLLTTALLSALLGEALLSGARLSVGHTSALLGGGDLTVQPESFRLGGSGIPLILETGAVFSNPALMRVPGRVAARVEVRVEASSAAGAQAVDMIGIESPRDPQAELLARTVVAGEWLSAEQPGEPKLHQIVLGRDLSGRLRLRLGDPVRVRAGAGNGLRSWTGKVVGILRTGLPELDGGRMWTGYSSAQELLQVPPSQVAEASTRIAIYLDRPADVHEWLAAIKKLSLPEGTEVLTWRQANPGAVPAAPWQRLQRKADAGAFALLAAVGIACGVLMAFAVRGITGGGLLVFMAVPPVMSAGLALLAYLCVSRVVNVSPIPPSPLFEMIGTGLNPFGSMVAGIGLHLRPIVLVELILVLAGAYAVGIVLVWRYFRAARDSKAVS